MQVKRLVGVISVAIMIALSIASPAAATTCACPIRYDHQIIDLAQTGVGSPYWWGHACWSTANRNWGGSDCSGFVIKAWQVPRSSSIGEDYHPYGTYHIFNSYAHWYWVARSEAWRADAIGYPDPDGSGAATGHVVLYYYGDPYGTVMAIEAPGSGLRIRQAWRDVSASKWRFRRRHNLRHTTNPA